mgnify:CR=1 FL=1
MTHSAETSRVAISKRGAALLREVAKDAGVTPREYLEALLHYGASQFKRPGSWEANTPFQLSNYVGEEAHADKWF